MPLVEGRLPPSRKSKRLLPGLAANRRTWKAGPGREENNNFMSWNTPHLQELIPPADGKTGAECNFCEGQNRRGCYGQSFLINNSLLESGFAN
jgi:hypothetical protein